MQGTQNGHKAAAQRRKAQKLVDAAMRIFEVGLDDSIGLEALAAALADAPDAQWAPLFTLAEVNPHAPGERWCSDEVRGFVAERLADLADLAAKPTEALFAGFPQ